MFPSCGLSCLRLHRQTSQNKATIPWAHVRIHEARAAEFRRCLGTGLATELAKCIVSFSPGRNHAREVPGGPDAQGGK